MNTNTTSNMVSFNNLVAELSAQTGKVYSKYQRDIFDEIVNGTDNLLIQAGAGSGKTSTLIDAIKLLKGQKSVLFVAFNKSIATELQEKLKGIDNTKAGTCHSIGFQLLKTNMKKLYCKQLQIQTNY